VNAVTKQSHACLLIRFKGVAGYVILPDEPALLDGIAQLAPSWKYTFTAIEDDGSLQRCITRVAKNQNNPSTFDVESVYVEEPLIGLPTASALCAVMADVLEAHIEESQNPIALHAGAVAISNRLIAITGPRQAGKSTLIARLCAEPDLQIFCDDVLPISPLGEGVALGVAPRLRLPLPAKASQHFKQFARQHLGPHDNRYGYLCTTNLAGNGTRLPLGAIVVLDRQIDTAACLHTMNEDDALFYALEQNMGQFDTPAKALATTQAVLGKVTCVRLVYSNLEEAVQLLRKAFGGDEAIHPDVPVKPAQGWTPPTPHAHRPVNPQQVFKRAPTAALRRIGQSAFLWQAGEHTIWRLNRVGQAVWVLLEIPGNARELVEALAEVFVQVPQEQLQHDVAALLGILNAEGFVVELSDPLALLNEEC